MADYTDPAVAGIKQRIMAVTRFADLSADELVKFAEQLGGHLVRLRLKANQVRKFLDAIRKIEYEGSGTEFSRDRVVFLKPKLAYAAGRTQEVKPLLEVIAPCLDKISADPRRGYEDFRKFAQFFEAIVAYHKFHGGQD